MLNKYSVLFNPVLKIDAPNELLLSLVTKPPNIVLLLFFSSPSSSSSSSSSSDVYWQLANNIFVHYRQQWLWRVDQKFIVIVNDSNEIWLSLKQTKTTSYSHSSQLRRQGKKIILRTHFLRSLAKQMLDLEQDVLIQLCIFGSVIGPSVSSGIQFAEHIFCWMFLFSQLCPNLNLDIVVTPLFSPIWNSSVLPRHPRSSSFLIKVTELSENNQVSGDK